MNPDWRLHRNAQACKLGWIAKTLRPRYVGEWTACRLSAAALFPHQALRDELLAGVKALRQKIVVSEHYR